MFSIYVNDHETLSAVPHIVLILPTYTPAIRLIALITSLYYLFERYWEYVLP